MLLIPSVRSRETLRSPNLYLNHGNPFLEPVCALGGNINRGSLEKGKGSYRQCLRVGLKLWVPKSTPVIAVWFSVRRQSYLVQTDESKVPDLAWSRIVLSVWGESPFLAYFLTFSSHLTIKLRHVAGSD